MSRAYLLLLLLPLLLSPLQQAGQDPEGTAPFHRQGAYVDDAEVCADCHQDEADWLSKGLHARVPGLKALHACETCHGPGEDHVELEEAKSITHPTKLDAKAQQALCASCHADQIADHGGPLSALQESGKRCTDCHRVHEERREIPGMGDDRFFLRRSELAGEEKAIGMDRCLECHADKEPDLRRGPHAALLLAEGEHGLDQQGCEGCHGHGEAHARTFGLRRLITRPDQALDGNATCLSCHQDVDPERFHWKSLDEALLGGPEGRALRCTSCHQVHGHAARVVPSEASPSTPVKAPALPTDGPASRPAGPGRTRQPASRPSSRPASRSARLQQVDVHLDAGLPTGACMRCHAPAYEVLKGSIHQSLVQADPAGKPPGCVSCHPGGGKHAASGGRAEFVASFREAPAQVQAQSCLQCHGGEKHLCGHASGIHAAKGVGCLDCHSPAADRSVRGKLRDAESSCGKCHERAAASFRRKRGHPVGEGSFGCSSCHQPHHQQRIGLATARRSQETCTDCHREYRGPFVFAHHADKGEGCLACHVPHDNGHPKLLNTRRVRDNCLACHADLPAFHDQSAGSVYRNCLACHVKIHGSNRNRFFFR